MTTGESAERIPPSLRTEALEQLLRDYLANGVSGGFH